MEIKCIRCEWLTIKKDVQLYYEGNNITVDSFWEDHVLSSNHYEIVYEGKRIGFFAIHNESMITLYHLDEHYANRGQEIFERIKRYEKVTHAFIPTSDEFFLSHAIDNYTRIEKQAYFSIYTNKSIPKEKLRNISLREVKTAEDIHLLNSAGDFFDDGTKDKLKSGSDYLKVYIVEDKDKGVIIGFGVIEYGRIVTSIGSIGMYVLEDMRQQSYATSILNSLHKLVEANGKKAHSGCWYYNHNSKKTMESTGAYTKTRLLLFYF